MMMCELNELNLLSYGNSDIVTMRIRFEHGLIRRIYVASNAIETIDDQMIHLIIYSLN